jgi:pilus assembly protein CpaB
MNIRTIATLAVAIVLGLLAVIILNRYLASSQKTQQVAAGGGAPVVVAAVPIPRGTALQPMFLKVVSYPQGSVPAGAFASVSQLSGAGGAQRIALRDLTPDEPILPAEITGPGGRLTLSTVIAPGMQAIAIRSSDVAGVGGFVLPGDRVDVLLTRSLASNSAQSNSVTQIVAENVRVMGVDQSDNEEADKPSVARSITLEVTPAQAQLIALGQSVGAITLSLRHVADAEALAQRATTVAQLGFYAPPPLPAAIPAAPAQASEPGGEKQGATPLYGPGIVRVTRATDTTGYRLEGRGS